MPTLITGRDAVRDDDERLDIATDSPNVAILKKEIENTQSDASDYYTRNQRAYDWWHSRWNNQTVDGRKWNLDRDDTEVWPWEGSSDTRVGTVAKTIGQHQTVIKYAFMNAHVQGKASQPFVSGKESERATILMNWMLYTHMLDEIILELPLLSNWRNGYGASVLWTDWEQERRIDYIPISLMALQQFAQQAGGQSMMLDFIQSALADPTQEKDMVQLVQMMSPIVSTAQAHKIIKDLRELRTAEIPVPYVYKSKPRWTALRPMVDILFPAGTDNLQRARWIDRVEWVTESDLVDRIETNGYDPGFVDEALDHKGSTMNESWASRTQIERQLFGRYTQGNGAYHDFEEKIELHHFYYKCLSRGVPTLYRTIFHMDLDEPAKHGQYGYKHGKYPCDAFRFEKHERPILSSRGIAEMAYTWEQEIKKQRDGRTDMTDLGLRPPMFTDYKDVLKIKTSFAPGVIWPRTRGNEPDFMPTPAGNSSSIEIEQSVEAMVKEYFGLFGNDVDPMLKKLRQQEVADDFLLELKRPVMQMWQLMQQYLPDDDVAKVTGPLSRPFQVDRQQIQGAYDFTVTVDLRELDMEFMKQKLNGIKELMTWDNAGTIDHTAIIRRAFEAFDYTLADEAIKSQESTTNKEIEDERRAIRDVLGSGVDVELPQGANMQLRAQTLQQYMSELMQSNPIVQKKLKDTPEIMDVLKNRLQYFQRQIQQQQNAQIGRSQVSNTFDKSAPQMALPQQ